MRTSLRPTPRHRRAGFSPRTNPTAASKEMSRAADTRHGKIAVADQAANGGRGYPDVVRHGGGRAERGGMVVTTLMMSSIIKGFRKLHASRDIPE